MTIRISGLGSGLDIDSLVSQMMQAKRIPIDQMKQKVTYLGWQRDAYRDMNTQMSSFLTEAQKLTLESTFLAKKASFSSTDTGKIQATPSASALSGNFTLQVKQIAKSASLYSSATLGVSADPTQALATADATLQITGSVGTDTVSITNGDSINKIVTNINAKTSTTGVKAVYDQLSDKLTLVNTTTGSAGNALKIVDTSATNILRDKLKISDTGTPDPNSTPDLSTTAQTNVIQGQDAIVNFNNTGDVTVSTNSFTMNNINFTLLVDPAGTPYTVNGSINSDVDAIVSTIKGVFDKYNEVIASANAKLVEPKYRDYPPLTDDQKKDMKDSDITLWEEKAKSGLLRNDSILSFGLDKMRQYLADNVSGIPSGQYDSLADIGITTAPSTGSNNLAYTENGKIYIDEDKLRDALTNNPDQVSALFTKDGARDANGNLTGWSDAGFGTRLYEIVNKDMISGLTQKTQTIPTKSFINLQIDDYTNRIQDAEAGLSDYEQQLYSQFSKMETALNNLNSQSSYLASLFQKQ